MKLTYPSETKKLEGSKQLLEKLETEKWDDLSSVELDYLEGYNKITNLFIKDNDLIKSTDTICVYEYAEEYGDNILEEFLGSGLKTNIELAKYAYEEGGQQAINDMLELNQQLIS